MDTGNTNQGGNGVSAATYYGAVALAVIIIICITLFSRIMYTRRLRRNLLARDRTEREAMERRGEAAGLPTYIASQSQAPAYPPRRRGADGELVDGLPAYQPPPPKYEEARMEAERNAAAGGGDEGVEVREGGEEDGGAARNDIDPAANPDSEANYYLEMQEHRPNVAITTTTPTTAAATTDSANEPTGQSPPSPPPPPTSSAEVEVEAEAGGEVEEEFVHPEERRRNEERRRREMERNA